MSVPAIQTEELRKVFGDQAAVKGLTLQVEQGEVFGFLGPNGAGKTTSMKMLLGLVAPTSGTANLLGAPIGDLTTRARVGFLPEHFRFQDWLTAREFLRLHGQLLGMEARDLAARQEQLLERVGLSPFGNKLLRTYSKGMLQRVGLAQALLNRPALVFLDEPTSGLDPHQIQEIRQLIRHLAHDKTVLLSTHILQEVEAVADRLVIINAGRIVGDGTLPELQQQTQRYARALFAVAAPRADVESALKELRGVRRLRCTGATESLARFELQAAPGIQILPEIGALAQVRGWQVGELQECLPTLEEVFLALTEPQDSRLETGV